MKDRVWLIGSGIALALIAVVGVALLFGTPQSPEVVSTDATSANQEPGAAAPGSPGSMPPATVDMPADGLAAPAEVTPGDSSGGDMSGMGAVDPDAQAPEADPTVPLAIEIPGCVCHSDDPAEVERHAAYRMNQCYGCHAGAGPQ